jgi:hypothetical protein
MKTTKSIVTSFVLSLLISMSAMAQSKSKSIAVINKADWCPVCEEHGKRAMKALKSNNKDGTIQFVANNLTNAETKEESAKSLKRHGLYKKMKSHNNTGVVFFFDAETKELINKISVAKPNKKLAAAVQQAKKE